MLSSHRAAPTGELQKYNYKVAILDGAILISWAVLLTDAYTQAKEIPLLLGEIEVPELIFLLFLPAAITVLIAIAGFTFWQRKRIMEEMPIVTKLMDKWFFPNAYEFFMGRLHAVYGSVVSSALFGLVGIWFTHHSSQHLISYGICAGSVFFSICMLFAVGLSRRYPPLLR